MTNKNLSSLCGCKVNMENHSSNMEDITGTFSHLAPTISFPLMMKKTNICARRAKIRITHQRKKISSKKI